MTRFQASLWAQNIKLGWLRKPNIFAVIEDKDGNELGRTETITSEESPDWTKICFIEGDPAKQVDVTVKLYHEKNPEPILLGEATFEVTEVNRATGHNLSKPIGKSGRITISVVESNPEMHGRVRIHLRGLDIRNPEPGLLGLGRSDPYFEISKSVTQHEVGYSDWNVVYRSEAIRQHLNPFWDEFEIGLEELCNGEMRKTLRIAVYDAKNNSKRLVGYFDTSLQVLQEYVGIKGNADRDLAFPLNQHEKKEGGVDTYGLICVLACEISETRT